MDNQGWWSATRIASDDNDNYLTGEVGGIHTLRSFFTFDLSTLDLTGQTIVSATFEAVRYAYDSPDPGETIALFDVSTDAAILNSNVGTSATIFADLGTGTTYGSFPVLAYSLSTTELLSFSLNAAALADIAAGAGGFFSIGASLQSITPGPIDEGQNEAVFSTSSGNGIQRLVLETTPTATAVPEPTSILLLGSGLVGAHRLRRRRKTTEPNNLAVRS